MYIIKKLVVDEFNDIFQTDEMEYIVFNSNYNKIREYTNLIIDKAPVKFKEGNLLSQQFSEIIKNAMKHGNLLDENKKVHVWYSFHKKAKFIVEDEGEGFSNLDEWNKYYYQRQTALYEEKFEHFLELASYHGPKSDSNDGGNSLIAALEYWNGGMIYNKKKNKVGVVRWYSGGSALN